MKLPDGRTVSIQIPVRWTMIERDGSVLLRPAAVRLIDRVQILATTYGLRIS